MLGIEKITWTCIKARIRFGGRPIGLPGIALDHRLSTPRVRPAHTTPADDGTGRAASRSQTPAARMAGVARRGRTRRARDRHAGLGRGRAVRCARGIKYGAAPRGCHARAADAVSPPAVASIDPRRISEQDAED